MIKLTVSYDGTNYNGWQIQKNGDTIQQRIENALFDVYGEKVTLTGSGRTDSGVHAKGQVASFIAPSENIPAEKIAKALNTRLPKDIRVLSSEKVSEDFNARFSAKKKTYLYKMYKSETVLPLLDRYALKADEKIDVKKMKKAAKLFVGEKDYAVFCASDTDVKSTVRKIYKSTVKVKGNEIFFYVTGNGFLYNMVRIMAGALLAVGEGKIIVSDLKNILISGKRVNEIKTLPANGLTLFSVEYE